MAEASGVDLAGVDLVDSGWAEVADSVAAA